MKISIPASLSKFNKMPLQRLSPCLLALLFLLAVGAVGEDKPADASRTAGWVVIPVEEYRVLRAKAYPVEHDPEPPPVDATLTRVDYDLAISGELAQGRANLTVDVLKDGWVRVPVPAGLLVRDAQLDGKQVPLVPGPQGKSASHLCALLSRSGRLVLSLEVDVPVTTSASNESISLPSTDSGITRASFELPRQGIDLNVDGGFVSEKSEAAGKTRWLAYGHGNEPLTLTWRKKTEDHHVELPLRMRGSLTQLTSLGEDATSVYAEASVEVVQGAAREVRIQLPQKITINQVSGAMIADWEMKGGELVVTFLEPVEHSARFVINGEARLPRDGVIDIPLLRLLNTERDSGGVAVEILGAGEIKEQKAQGLEDADASDLGEMIATRQSPALAAFRARQGEAGVTRNLSVNVARYDQQAVLMANVEEARYDILMSADGKELVQARYAVRNNQRNFVKITLPAGASVWSATLGGRPARPGQSPDGSLLLPLEKSRGGEDAPAFVVELMYVTKATRWDEKGKETVTLPALDLPISRTGMLLYYPPLFRVSAEPGTFRTEEYQAPVSAALAATANEAGGVAGFAVAAPVVGPVGNAPAVAQSGQDFDALKQLTNDDKEKKDATQALLDTFRSKAAGGKVTGILPVNVDFPAFGPSIYLVSELTSENQSPSAEFNFQRDKKAGAR